MKYYSYLTYESAFLLNSDFSVQTQEKLTDSDRQLLISGQKTSVETNWQKEHDENLVFSNKKDEEGFVYATLEELEKILAATRDVTNFSDMKVDAYVTDVSAKIKASVGWDQLVIQSIKSIEEVDVTINMLAKRLREFYEWHNPDHSRAIESHEAFAKSVITQDESYKTEMGTAFSDEAMDTVRLLAAQIVSMSEYKEKTREFIEDELGKYMPNFLYIAGAQVGAKLLASAGGFYSLMKMPASTIQLLGAEKALFRHLRSGSLPPKYGLLFQHKMVQNVSPKAKGRRARSLASVLNIAVKKDYFSPEDDNGTELAEQLMKKFEVTP